MTDPIPTSIPPELSSVIPTAPDRARLALNIGQAYVVARQSNETSARVLHPNMVGTPLVAYVEKPTAQGSVRAIKDNENGIKHNSFEDALEEWIRTINQKPGYASWEGSRGGVYDNPTAQHELMMMAREYVAVNLQYNSWATNDLITDLSMYMEKNKITGWTKEEIITKNLEFLSSLQRTFPDADKSPNGNLTKMTMLNNGYIWDNTSQSFVKKTS